MTDTTPSFVAYCPNLELAARLIEIAKGLGWCEPSLLGKKILAFNYGGNRGKKIDWDLDRNEQHGKDTAINSAEDRGIPCQWYNAEESWETILTILRGEPEFDTTPLPYDMTPELQAETMAKFNLSSEQWDLMPLMVREALAECEVKKQELKVEAEWLPISEPPRGSPTVLFTTNPNQPRSSVRDCALGYFLGEHMSIVYGEDGRRFTHWCHLPGPVVDHEEEEEEPDGEEA